MLFLNAMSRFRAWSLMLPMVACSALGFIPSFWEQGFLSHPAWGLLPRRMRTKPTGKGDKSSVWTQSCNWRAAVNSDDLGPERRCAHGLLVAMENLGLVHADALHLLSPGGLAAPCTEWRFLPVLCHFGLIEKNSMDRGLSNTPLLLAVLEAGRLRSRGRKSWCLVRIRFLVCRRPPSCCVLTWWRESSGRVISFQGHHSHHEGPPSWPHLNLILSPKPTSRNHHIGD